MLSGAQNCHLNKSSSFHTEVFEIAGFSLRFLGGLNKIVHFDQKKIDFSFCLSGFDRTIAKMEGDQSIHSETVAKMKSRLSKMTHKNDTESLRNMLREVISGFAQIQFVLLILFFN